MLNRIELMISSNCVFFSSRSPPGLMVMNPSSGILAHDKFPITILREDHEIGISNEHLTLSFAKTGFVKSVTEGGTTHPFRISMNQ